MQPFFSSVFLKNNIYIVFVVIILERNLALLGNKTFSFFGVIRHTRITHVISRNTARLLTEIASIDKG